MQLVTVDVDGSVDAGFALIVEVAVPSFFDMAGGLTGDVFIPGANDAGETVDSYVNSVSCGVLDPTALDDFGFFASHLVMTVVGDPTVTCCCADFDADGVLDLFDFLAFQSAFALADPRADFNGDGELTIFDFLQFQTEFDAGCP